MADFGNEDQAAVKYLREELQRIDTEEKKRRENRNRGASGDAADASPARSDAGKTENASPARSDAGKTEGASPAGSADGDAADVTAVSADNRSGEGASAVNGDSPAETAPVSAEKEDDISDEDAASSAEKGGSAGTGDASPGVGQGAAGIRNSFLYSAKSFAQKLHKAWKKFCGTAFAARLQKIFASKAVRYYLPVIAKFAFAVILTFLTWSVTGESGYIVNGLLELLVIFWLGNALVRKHKVLSYIVSDALMLMYNLQYIFLFFSGSYLTLYMLENTDSINGLAGRMGTYVTGALLMIFFSCLPIRYIGPERHFSSTAFLSAALAFELGFTMTSGSGWSPLYCYYSLAAAAADKAQMASGDASGTNITSEFYHTEVKGGYTKPESLSDHPNVILIFTEGLSENIIDDTRNIMPNVSSLREKSVRFTNYFNHAFATYNGLIGQLYSGYQVNNYDTNSLVSLQSVFEDAGYQTSFINTEPMNMRFTEYLGNMNFQNLVSETDSLSGSSQTLSDKEAYELLYDTCAAQAKSGRPFFTAIYTYGTHLSLDSVDEKYGDGSNTVLNKFYDADYQFGAFMKKFEESDFADNTVIVFTADHATYADQLYRETFSDYGRVASSVDRIPFYIYCQGLKAQEIDVSGRNSLDMTPTVLDFVDISDDNYFLGTSLFTEGDPYNSYDTFYFDGNAILTTEGGEVASPDKAIESLMRSRISDYNTAKQQTPVQANASK